MKVFLLMEGSFSLSTGLYSFCDHILFILILSYIYMVSFFFPNILMFVRRFDLFYITINIHFIC